MHKTKDGKVIASLTEVKNKTGDIFALVDEYGEVTLTSYNKPRYRINKIEFGSILEVKEKPERKSMFDRVKETVIGITDKPKESEKEDTLIPFEILRQLTKMKAWDRINREERKHMLVIKKPLQ